MNHDIIEKLLNNKNVSKITLQASFKNFIKVVFFYINGVDFTFTPSHDKVIKALEDIVFGKNEKRNLGVSVAVGFGKSVLCQYFIAWTYCIHKNQAYVYTSHSDTNIKKFSKEIKDILESSFIKKLFNIELQSDEKSKDSWSIKGAIPRTGLKAKTIKSGITGADAGNRAVKDENGKPIYSGALISDDLIDVDKMNNEIEKQGVIDFYLKKGATRRRTEITPSIIIMQRLTVDDFMAYLKNNEAEDWNFIEIPVLDENDNSIWEEVFPREKMIKMRDHSGTAMRELFYSQYQQQPIASAFYTFREEWLQFYGGWNNTMNGNIYITVDPAHSKKKDSDYTVICAIALCEDQNYYLVDMVRDKLNMKEKTEMLFQFVKLYNPINIGYERYGMQSDIECIKDEQDRLNFRFRITELAGKISKDERIRTLQPQFELGKWYLPKQIIRQNYENMNVNIIKNFIEEEYKTHPSTKNHDDALDCMARINDPDLKAAFPTPNIDFYHSEDNDSDEYGQNSIGY